MPSLVTASLVKVAENNNSFTSKTSGVVVESIAIYSSVLFGSNERITIIAFLNCGNTSSSRAS